MFKSYVDETLARVKKQNPDQPEFNQAVYEVLESLRPVIEKNEDAYRRDALLERLTTTERAVLFRVPWVDDKGQVQVNNGFLVQNMHYNSGEDYYVCPMGQHLERCGTRHTVSDLGYRSEVAVYRAANCKGCPLRGMCYNGRADRRTLEVNHTANGFKRRARELLTGERGMMHRSNRPIEPEAVFGDIKFNHGFRRFRLKSNRKVMVEFGLVALAHNLRKYSAVLSGRMTGRNQLRAAL